MRLDADFRALMPKLTQDEYSKLEQHILAEGCRDALVLWDDILIDGYNRYEICTKHNLEFKTILMQFDNREAVTDWIIDNQLGKRNLTVEQKNYLIGKKYKREKQAHGGDRKSSSKSELDGKVSERIANENKVSVGTVVNAEKFADAVDIISENVGDEARDEILARDLDVTFKEIQILAKQPVDMQKMAIAEVRNGKSMREAIQIFKQQQRDDDIAVLKIKLLNGIDLPQNVFEVVVIDPPWPYGTQYNPDTRRAASPYPEMTKARMNKYYATGIDTYQYNNYTNLTELYQIPLFLFFVDEHPKEKRIYGNFLHILSRSVEVNGETYPLILKDTTLFHLSTMKDIIKLSDSDCAILQQYSSRSYDYESNYEKETSNGIPM